MNISSLTPGFARISLISVRGLSLLLPVFIKCLNWINEFLAPSTSIRLSSLDASACLSMSLARLSGP